MAALGSLSFSSLASSSSSSPKPSSFLATATLRPRFFLCTPFAAKMSAASASCSSVSGNAAASAVASVGQDLPDDYEEWTPKPDPRDRRRAGVLLHPTSFRGPYGIGDFGAEAFRFIDWLHQAGCSVWQVLPLVPPGRKANEEGSPYSGQDANCGNTLLISLEELVKDGLLEKAELPQPIDAERVNFAAVADLKDPLIAKAAERLIQSDGELKSQLENFHKDPSISTLEEIYQSKKDFIDLFIAQQFLFQRQWQKVRNYAQMKGISIMGDMPIYVGYHSADVWANKKHFLLNRRGFPLEVSGVPPDAFSETGQLWGSPLYDWKAMEKDGFSWWIHRIRRARDLYDEFRIDHFRGFAGFWAVPSEAKVAMDGRWKVGPGKSLFDAIFRSVGNINIIAEDLGVITEDVVQLRKSIGAPGMAVLQFGFGSDSKNPHLPHNHERNQVVYTGTHDNDTIRGWWDTLKNEEKSNVMKYLSISEEDDISWKLIQAALSSVAQTAVIPLQDILRLGVSARMNIPATQFGNWSWRIPSSTSFDRLETEATKLRDLLSTYGRL
ncbi:4-alpha-glucanotransferase DPE1 /amyloplastic [Citrus sinensis]|uniref:4-alpha-glucanotransferase DPE1 /amyloplastic n=1 Tax=Citrus sinensis TaxID=2711 RepID=A0ACB8JKI6_CITSI|nr:4-alpha-glucanotransferase DPE1 /amyloplastic [Citrus sinensis]